MKFSVFTVGILFNTSEVISFLKSSLPSVASLGIEPSACKSTAGYSITPEIHLCGLQQAA